MKLKMKIAATVSIAAAFLFTSVWAEQITERRERKRINQEEMSQKMMGTCENCSNCDITGPEKRMQMKARERQFRQKMMLHKARNQEMREVNLQIRELAQAYKAADSESEKESIEKKIREKVSQRYDIMKKYRQKIMHHKAEREEIKDVNIRIRQLAQAYKTADNESEKESIEKKIREKVSQRYDTMKKHRKELMDKPAQKRQMHQWELKDKDAHIDAMVERILQNKSEYLDRKSGPSEQRKEMKPADKGQRKGEKQAPSSEKDYI